MNKYSILIPIHNELRYIELLLKELKYFSRKGHEIIIIDDGSSDGSKEALTGQKDITLISLPENFGKGYALRKGLEKAVHESIIIYDGDLELNPLDISKLMQLDRSNNVNYVMGNRFKSLNPLKSSFEWGNFMFTSLFNIIFKSNHKDILCCAKAFFLNDLKSCKPVSKGFDIDIELSSILTIQNSSAKVTQVMLEYNRRGVLEGKKLKIIDGWSILLRIFKMLKYL